MRRGTIVFALIAVLTAIGGAAPAEPIFLAKPGETLTYRIYVAGIALAEEKLCVTEAKSNSGRALLAIEMRLDSFKSVFNLIDYHEHRSITFDPESGAPLEERARIVQRNSVTEESFVFDAASGLVSMTKRRGDRTTTDSKPFVPGAQTGCSLLYHLRGFPWEQGRYRLAIFGNDGIEWYSYTVDTVSSFRVPFGRFDRVYHLVNKALGYEVWFDRGPGRLPLEIRSRLGFGVAQARLIGATGYE